MRAVRQTEFERLFDEHAQRLFAFLVYRTGNRTLAEDIVADTFEAAFRARRRFDRRKASEKTWLYTIALNRLRDHARRQAVEERALARIAADPAPAGDAEWERLGDRDAVMRALRTLSDDERECIALRFGAGMSLKEVAAAIGEPRTTVEARVYRALRKLKAELE